MIKAVTFTMKILSVLLALLILVIIRTSFTTILENFA